MTAFQTVSYVVVWVVKMSKSKERRERLKEQGLCYECGRVPARPGKLQCADCAKRSNASFRRNREKGLCERCGKVPPRDGRLTCAECAKTQNEVRRRANQKRKKCGLCTACGQAPPRLGMYVCLACAEKSKERKQTYKDRAYQAYGGYVCRCCGETRKPFLTIDHIDGGGAQHRKQICNSHMHYWLFLLCDMILAGS